MVQHKHKEGDTHNTKAEREKEKKMAWKYMQKLKIQASKSNAKLPIHCIDNLSVCSNKTHQFIRKLETTSSLEDNETVKKGYPAKKNNVLRMKKRIQREPNRGLESRKGGILNQGYKNGESNQLNKLFFIS